MRRPLLERLISACRAFLDEWRYPLDRRRYREAAGAHQQALTLPDGAVRSAARVEDRTNGRYVGYLQRTARPGGRTAYHFIATETLLK